MLMRRVPVGRSIAQLAMFELTDTGTDARDGALAILNCIALDNSYESREQINKDRW